MTRVLYRDGCYIHSCNSVISLCSETVKSLLGNLVPANTTHTSICGIPLSLTYVFFNCNGRWIWRLIFQADLCYSVRFFTYGSGDSEEETNLIHITPTLSFHRKHRQGCLTGGWWAARVCEWYSRLWIEYCRLLQLLYIVSNIGVICFSEEEHRINL